MATLGLIEEAAKKWNETKDPKYRDLWYKRLKEWNGYHNSKRRNLSTSHRDQTDGGWYRVIK
jgi:hypothetical protein